VGRTVDRLTTSGRSGREVGAIEPLAVGACDPEPDGGQGDAEASCDLAEGDAPSDGGDDLTTTILGSVFGPRETSNESG
jgi:hypothetical protein